MRLFRLVGLPLLFLAPLASAVSIFPDLTNVPVAVTTNREVARGIAFDGTNFLVVFQGDNLYASANPTNQLAAQMLSTDGALAGSRIDLQLNGSIPLVAFGTSSYLMVWADPANASIYGQLLDRNGAKQGAAFLVASNANASEVGSMVFAHGQFCVVWSAASAETNAALIQAQRLSASGELLGPMLAVGAASSTNQQFPHVDDSTTNFFLTWVAQRSDTNAWDVLGRFIDVEGNAAPEFIISQTSAGAPYPVASAFDGTNHLVVWSREAGPEVIIRTNYYFRPMFEPERYVTNFSPMLFGAVVNLRSTPVEFQISSARFGQVAPSAAFAGTNYLVAWNDHRHATFLAIPPPYPCTCREAWVQPTATNQTVFFCFVSVTPRTS